MKTSLYYKEKYRPQFHFAPDKHWMNDPNGLVYYKGEYHLFYQHNPVGNKWGHMSWGHAVSKDLLHWKQLPVAIPEESGIMIFSGCTVVDRQNTSGFGIDGKPPMIAIYTGFRKSDGIQFQCLAYSNDSGRSWMKHQNNPVLDIHSKSFRDPKVFWYEPHACWLMVAALADERKVQFYTSPDLKSWQYLSSFGPAGGVNGIWECPDFFPLPDPDDPDQSRWILKVDVCEQGVAERSGAQYFTGQFDGRRFTADGIGPVDDFSNAADKNESNPEYACHAQVNRVDYGADFYAAVSWNDLPAEDGRRIWLGWMNNWAYAESIPTTPWRGAQSIPRELSLKKFADGIRLVQKTVRELQKLRKTHRRMEDFLLTSGQERNLITEGSAGLQYEIELRAEVREAEGLSIKLRQGKGQETIIRYDRLRETLSLDRTRSGETGFNKTFAAVHEAPCPLTGGLLKLHILVDWSSVEIFAEEGTVVITAQIFPDAQDAGVALAAQKGDVKIIALDFWELNSVWGK